MTVVNPNGNGKRKLTKPPLNKGISQKIEIAQYSTEDVIFYGTLSETDIDALFLRDELYGGREDIEKAWDLMLQQTCNRTLDQLLSINSEQLTPELKSLKRVILYEREHNVNVAYVPEYIKAQVKGINDVIEALSSRYVQDSLKKLSEAIKSIKSTNQKYANEPE